MYKILLLHSFYHLGRVPIQLGGYILDQQQCHFYGLKKLLSPRELIKILKYILWKVTEKNASYQYDLCSILKSTYMYEKKQTN